MSCLGLLGGTFDPIHRGHLGLARAALAETGIERVLFVPAAKPPHKEGQAPCSYRHRLRMLESAVAELSGCSISTIEADDSEPSYTYKTLQRFKERGGAEDRYRFIIGGDAFVELPTWYRWQEVLYQTDFVVGPRVGSDRSRLWRFLSEHRFSRSSESGRVWLSTAGDGRVYVLDAALPGISSTQVRAEIAAGGNWRSLVPEAVAEYISANRLYC